MKTITTIIFLALPSYPRTHTSLTTSQLLIFVIQDSEKNELRNR